MTLNLSTAKSVNSEEGGEQTADSYRPCFIGRLFNVYNVLVLIQMLYTRHFVNNPFLIFSKDINTKEQ